MKQILQSLETGLVSLAEVPVPQCGDREVLIRTNRSLVSAGTERMLLNFGRAGWFDKARQQPEKLKLVREKVLTDGLIPTLESIRAKLEAPIALGYSNVGVVVSRGGRASKSLRPGMRVVSNGSHAEFVSVGQNLVVPVPDILSDDEASFAIVGAIALQGIRLVAPSLGEKVVVIGLGLVGLLTVQILKANGCDVLGVDVSDDKVSLARDFGVDALSASKSDVLNKAARFSTGRGVDAVIITASTKSNDPIRLAAQMSRQRGRIVLVGVVGLDLVREEFYEKELTFQVSSSYGPGRYDPSYTSGGVDYPYGFVRWTAKRNIEAFLNLLVNKSVNVNPLISGRFNLLEARKGYDFVVSDPTSLGIIFDYSFNASLSSVSQSHLNRAIEVADIKTDSPSASSAISLGFIGSGNYAAKILIPAFRKAGARLDSVSCRSGLTGVQVAKRNGIGMVTTDNDSVFASSVNGVVISTRHSSHAELVLSALRAGKHVFVEKPLCLKHEEIDEIDMIKPKELTLMVGFNRRFAPFSRRMKSLLAQSDDFKYLVFTINAGAIPSGHWVHDQFEGGGRLVGECCHFIDLARYFIGKPIVKASVTPAAGDNKDTFCINLTFEDSSVASINYISNGSKRYPKEIIEAFCAGRVLRIENFKKMTGFGWPGFGVSRSFFQDKGQLECAKAFVENISGNMDAKLIPYEEILEVSRVTLDLAQYLHD